MDTQMLIGSRFEAGTEIAEQVLNGTGPDGETQAISREEIEGRMLPMEFVGIYRVAVKLSGLNP